MPIFETMTDRIDGARKERRRPPGDPGGFTPK
jgi:hypothetical protein